MMEKLTKKFFSGTVLSGKEAADIIKGGGLLHGVVVSGDVSLCGLNLTSLNIHSCIILGKIDLEQTAVGTLNLFNVNLAELSLCRLKKIMALEIDDNTEITTISVSISGASPEKKLNNSLKAEDWLNLKKHSRTICLKELNSKIDTFLGFFQNVQTNVQTN
jgi:hypothetical protein